MNKSRNRQTDEQTERKKTWAYCVEERYRKDMERKENRSVLFWEWVMGWKEKERDKKETLTKIMQWSVEEGNSPQII